MSEIHVITGSGFTPPRWALMWLLAGALFFAGKAAVWMRQGRRNRSPWPLWKTAAWWLLWPGMDAAAWCGPTRSRPSLREAAGAGATVLLGLFLLYFAARRFAHPLAAGWCGMVGFILLLHFGAFRLLAVFWKSLGVHAAPIMDFPLAATSLAEFWGRRWNTAFRDLAHALVFRPVARRRGKAAALWASFAVSGLAHELVISVPAGAGFGLPATYFLLQALGITLERSTNTTSESRATGWCLTHAFTALPAFILFHPPFVERVMVPFFHAIGAL